MCWASSFITDMFKCFFLYKYQVIIGPLLVVLCVARYMYQKSKVQKGIDLQHVTKKKPQEEWHDVLNDSIKMKSIVYHADQTKRLSETNEDILVLLIPGNPGVGHFYIPLMREIAQKNYFANEIRCLPHTGHSNPWENDNQVFSLQDQLMHKIDFVRQRLAKQPTLQLVLIGHSIGCYIVVQLMKIFPSNIRKIVFLQPAMRHMAKTPKGQEMMPFFKHYPWVVRLVHLFDFALPTQGLRHWIVKKAIGSGSTHLEDVLQHAAVSLIDGKIVENIFKMAWHEMEEVHEISQDILHQNEHKIMFVYSKVDEWVPDEYVTFYRETFVNAKHRLTNTHHAFMMVHEGTSTIAEHVWEWIQDALHHPPATTTKDTTTPRMKRSASVA
jgi:pimeloyl-ACP methyl ester carboxylesterase